MHALNYIPKRRWEREGGSPLYLPRYDRQPHRKRSIPHPQVLITFNIAMATGGTTNTVTTTGIDTSGATLIILAASTYLAGADAISDSKGNTWTALAASTSTAARMRLYYANAATGTFTVGSSHTFTNAATGGFPALAALAVNGATTSAAYDSPNQSGNIVNSGTALKPGALTASADNYLYVTGLGWDQTITSLAIDSGFTIPTNGTSPYSAGNSEGVSIAYFIQTTAAALDPQWTWAGGSALAASRMAVFKVGAAASVVMSWLQPTEVPMRDKAGVVGY